MAGRHFLTTSLFWLICIGIVWQGAHFVAPRWPFVGDIFGILGTLALFLPTASDIAWDVLIRMQGTVFGPDGKPLPTSEGYVPFSWKRAWLNALGITLIGLGFGVNFLAKGP